MSGEGREGERVIPPSRRPDGSLRKEIRIRAGYVPQDEVATYQSKGSGFRGVPGLPPGLDPSDAASAKSKTKAAKKNEKRKEKKKQDEGVEEGSKQSTRPDSSAHPSKAAPESSVGGRASDSARAPTAGSNPATSPTPPESKSGSQEGTGKADLEKQIRALRKKIRQTESLEATIASGAVLTPEQSDKLSKMRSWEEQVADLESRIAAM